MISPELPERTADMAAKQKLTFPILWDERSGWRRPSPAFACPTTRRRFTLGFSSDLAVQRRSVVAALPSRFVVDGSGIVRFVQADPDYLSTRGETRSGLRQAVG